MKKVLIAVLIFLVGGIAFTAISKANIVAMPFVAMPFKDVSGYYVPYLNSLYTRGIVTGYSDTAFGPSNFINRGEAVTIIGKTLGKVDDEMTKIEDIICAGFKDADFSNQRAKDKFKSLCTTNPSNI